MAFLEMIGFEYDPNLMTQLGVILVITFLGSKIFQKFGFPQVVGFIVVGFLLGDSVLHIIPLSMVENLSFISYIALGLIGYDIGSHLHFKDLRSMGKSIISILLFESMGTFVLVFIGFYLITHNLPASLIIAAVAAATDPASTVDVLAEYDAKGPLTTSLLTVVGLDDAMALMLYSAAAAVTECILSGSGTISFMNVAVVPLYEIGGSVLLGLGIGFLLDFMMSRIKTRHDTMAISIGAVILCVGLAQAFGFSVILATMTMGSVVVNYRKNHGRHVRYTIEQAGPVVYVLFFSLVGARLEISHFVTMGVLVLAYVLLRSLGKYVFAWIGGKVGGAEKAVTQNLGFGLLSQAGVAIGLAMDSAERFSAFGMDGQNISTMIIALVTTTTFIVQIIGPIFVKFAVKRSGEYKKARDADSVWASEGTPDQH